MNTEECEWDGGDCCGPQFDKEYCDDCQCLDPAFSTTPKPPASCENSLYVGDKFCDDETNNKDSCHNNSVVVIPDGLRFLFLLIVKGIVWLLKVD